MSTPADPPDRLVNRAYDVGAFATAAPVAPAAGPSSDVPDRTGVIRAMGVIQIVLGGLLGIAAIGAVVGAAMVARGAGAMVGAIFYILPTANLLVTGIGSVRIAAWARRATLISSAIWLVLMLLAAVSVAAVLLRPGGGLSARGGEKAMLTIVMVPVFLVAIALPIVLLVVYTRPSVRATFERRRRQPT